MKTEIVLIRHGETEWNRAGRIQGHSDSGLTSEGIAQAQAVARRLEHDPACALISSDLGRARQTAAIIGWHRKLRVHVDERLRERKFGVAEGQHYVRLNTEYPEMFSRERETNPDYTPPGGESRQQHYDRVQRAMISLSESFAGRRIIVVTHGGVLSCVYRWLRGIAVAAPHPIDIPNVGYNVIEHADAMWSIRVWGDVSHLDRITAETC